MSTVDQFFITFNHAKAMVDGAIWTSATIKKLHEWMKGPEFKDELDNINDISDNIDDMCVTRSCSSHWTFSIWVHNNSIGGLYHALSSPFPS